MKLFTRFTKAARKARELQRLIRSMTDVVAVMTKADDDEDGDPVRVHDLCIATRTPMEEMNRTLAHMERYGFIEVDFDAEGRRYFTLTDKGRDISREALLDG